MTLLKDKVNITRRFRRSINIAADIDDPAALEGFVFSPSYKKLIENMARHVSAADQGAFTWTGPYGTGKSSLAVAFAGMLCASQRQRTINASTFGKDFVERIWQLLPPKRDGWKVVPVVGQRDDPVDVISHAIEQSEFLNNPPKKWTPSKVISSVKQIAAQDQSTCGGLIVVIDEMGKFLEAAAQDEKDVFIFQELAEAASRSKGRLIVIGVLHQTFQEYANQLSRELREEWSKIQGRYIDLVVDASGPEQIELISKAIFSGAKPKDHTPGVQEVAATVSKSTGANERSLRYTLEKCWPLHPTVTCLLGPISRRRFGQNQRSIFGFLSSAEPHGFQEFLATSTDCDLYYPEDLWNYLRSNLEPSILASPDGHRWAMAVEALERCEGLSDDVITVNALKCISLIDLFKSYRVPLRP